ncbi:MAG TPA: iron ABC transporter permease [Dokdonella sp.]|uniref:ABC transporter permease n=1 Tax=Dokdonella sp. TaxID=2291710 RepID=UPI002B9362BA|nr:iron ABC transporter permease [Dokdonella sp.]HUD43226.1 iron ABC transporter permease [Dokdonella sp.]
MQANPPSRGHGLRGWRIATGLIAALVLVPVLALLVAALGGDAGLWPHLLAHVLPPTLFDTAVLLAGVGVLVVLLGTGSAWLVTAYDFRGRGVLDWALLLPLAVPTYIVAYAYMDLLHPIGPVQSFVRELFGLAGPQAFRLPEIRSLGGCVFVLGFVLYPYVYLTTRALFLMQSASLLEAARSLGAGRGGVFVRVAVPLARPAIAVGTSLALMETINDVGASEFLGARTLTISIYSTWVNRADLAGAAQIALAMLAVVAALLALEHSGRRRQRYAASAQRARRMAPQRLHGASGLGALALGAVPVLIGFVAPTAYLVVETIERVRFAGFPTGLLRTALDTVVLSAVATAATVLLGLLVAYAARVAPGAWSRSAERIAGLGYALPGTVLAIGLLFPLGALDGLIADAGERWFGVAGGLLLLGSGAALVYAYSVRFLAVASGGIAAGLGRVAPALDQAARTLGERSGGVLRRIHLPLIRPAVAAAALLVFVDCMKELPATLLLRPLNLETLSTRLYAEAARGTYEEGAIAALIIVAAGLIPVLLLARVGRNAPRL